MNPQFADNYYHLALIRAKRQAWPLALQAAQTAVQINPFRGEMRALLITALIETGNRARAEDEFAVLGATHPDYQKIIRPWYEDRLKNMK